MNIKKILLVVIVLYGFNLSSRSHTFFSDKTKLLDLLLHKIDVEQSSIIFAVFSLTHPEVARALVYKHKQGVIVQGVVDELSTAQLGWQGNYLQRHGVDVQICRSNNNSCMHHKFAIFGGSEVLKGSANWIRAGLEGANYEDLTLFVDDPLSVQQFEQRFYNMYWKVKNQNKK